MKWGKLYPLVVLILFAACTETEDEGGDGGGTSDTYGAVTCEVSPSLPADLADGAGQSEFDGHSWHTFLALNDAGAYGTGTPVWTRWSSTSSYLDLVSEWAAAGGDPSHFPEFGATYYPPACLEYCQQEGIDCNNYRTLTQVGKINDSVFEANSTGLSSNPVIAANGTFLRYEILINRAMYDFVSKRELYDVDNLVTSNVNAPFGIMNLKLAWMDVTGVTAGDYHTEELLVFTSADTSSTGTDSCELVDMGLVGMHIAHKTPGQPSLVWSTFEQVSNAPDCGAFTAEAQAVNAACPSTVASSWNFYSSDCQADTTSGMCADCNTPPSSNQPGGVSCTGGFCVDLPPSSTSGYSRLCRQVPVTAEGPYSDSYA